MSNSRKMRTMEKNYQEAMAHPPTQQKTLQERLPQCRAPRVLIAFIMKT